MNDDRRTTARDTAYKYLLAGDPLGWFEDLYDRADGDPAIIPWADLSANPNLISWLDERGSADLGRTALKVGCGLGDDAEELARRGFETTAFDVSATAVDWCGRRFPRSRVSYVVADLLSAPKSWKGAFDFVLEAYTLQVLPPELRDRAMRSIASFVADGGLLLVIARGREPDETEGRMPWPLTGEELSVFRSFGLHDVSFEDYMDDEEPPVRRFRAMYLKR